MAQTKTHLGIFGLNCNMYDIWLNKQISIYFFKHLAQCCSTNKIYIKGHENKNSEYYVTLYVYIMCKKWLNRIAF